MGATWLVAARKVARQPRAERDPARARRDTRIEGATAAATLAGDDLTVAEIAVLTDLPSGQVRRLLTLPKAWEGRCVLSP